MASIYDLTDEWKQIQEMSEDPSIDPKLIADMLESIGGEIEEKAERYAEVMANLEADIGPIEKEINRLYTKKTVLLRNIDDMKRRLCDAMMETGKTKFKNELHSFSVQKTPPRVVIKEDAEIPEKYLIPQNPKIDKKQIAADLKAGQEMDFAHLEQGQTVRIR